MTWTFCLSGSAVAKAGANATYDATNVAALDGWCDEAEDYVCALARADVITNSGSLTANGINVISNFVSNLIAQKIVNYDMSGYTSRNEAIMMLNVIENEVNRGIKLFKDDNVKTYMGIT